MALSPLSCSRGCRPRLHEFASSVASTLAEANSRGYRGMVHKHLRQLERVWIENPIYFMTTCSAQRRPVLASDGVAKILIDEWQGARQRHGWVVGAYIIMPDHVHFFCAPEHDAKPLSGFMREWKSWSSRRIHALLPRSATAATMLWQREYFDHVLRSVESYFEKWDYVRYNPVRAKLIAGAENWPYSGTIEFLQR